MKKMIIPEERLCRDCKHTEPACIGFRRCRLYQPMWQGDELIISNLDKLPKIRCPLSTLKFNGLGHRYIRRKIKL